MVAENEQDEFSDVSDAGLDAAEAQSSQEDVEDEAEDEQDFNDYAAADKTKRDKETAEFLAVTAGADVNQTPFEELTSSQIGELNESKFGEYLAFREAGGEPPVDSVDEEEPIPLSIPDWAVPEITPEDQWQKRLQGMYGVGHDQDGAVGGLES